MKENKMREIRVEKVTLNIGAGADQDNVEKAVTLLKSITKKTPVKTMAKKRIATWKIRPGLPIGAKVTVRGGKECTELLKKLLTAVNFEVYKNQFTENGFSFGIKEYIDIPDVKYDPKIGIIGLDASVSLERPGYRVKRRKIQQTNIPSKHKITKDESMKFASEKLKVIVTETKRKEIRGY